MKRERAEDFVGTEEGPGIKRIKRWKETLPNGKTYYTLDLVENSYYDNTPPYVVPVGNYFMMGDNRDNSTDSRVLSQVGYVPFDNLVGRAEIIFFSVGDGEAAWKHLALALGRPLGPVCSRSFDEPARPKSATSLKSASATSLPTRASLSAR